MTVFIDFKHEIFLCYQNIESTYVECFFLENVRGNSPTTGKIYSRPLKVIDG